VAAVLYLVLLGGMGMLGRRLVAPAPAAGAPVPALAEGAEEP
jgi:cobyric acid synthase